VKRSRHVAASVPGSGVVPAWMASVQPQSADVRRQAAHLKCADGETTATLRQGPASPDDSPIRNGVQGGRRTSPLQCWYWWLIQGGVALLLLALSTAPPVRAAADAHVRVHHLTHAGLLAAGALLGRLIVADLRRGLLSRRPGSAATQGRLAWLLMVAGPLVVMAAMIPATSPFVDAHPVLHFAEHGALLLAGAIITGAAASVSRSIGWFFVLLLPLMAVVFAGMVAANL
jgi:hypothetical protein